MNNQSLDSLAIITTRGTHVGVDAVSQIMVSNLVTLCQTLDLRAMRINS